MIFLSTLSLRRATGILLILIIGFSGFLSTLSLRRATQWEGMKSLSEVISIHALLAESDVAPLLAAGRAGYFYPRSPCGERHQRHLLDSTHRKISIHALLAESDWPPVREIIQWEDFYPRSPCGERLELLPKRLGNTLISIHALLAESDES